MPTFSIEEFKSHLKDGFARPNRYFVTITPPPMLMFSIKMSDIKQLVYVCEMAELPGKSLEAIDDMLYGPNRKMPFAETFADLNLTFLCSKSLNEKRIFDEWQQFIVDDSFAINYFDYYKGDISIVMCDEKGKPMYEIQCQECYPSTVTGIPLSYSETDSIARLLVTFTYRLWKKIPLRGGDYNTIQVVQNFMSYLQENTSLVQNILGGALNVSNLLSVTNPIEVFTTIQSLFQNPQTSDKAASIIRNFN
jgi:hypothetical protein